MVHADSGAHYFGPPRCIFRCCFFASDLAARFQAPGEQVEIVKSQSQPHLNGLQGYVDFSCLTWGCFFFVLFFFFRSGVLNTDNW